MKKNILILFLALSGPAYALDNPGALGQLKDSAPAVTRNEPAPGVPEWHVPPPPPPEWKKTLINNTRVINEALRADALPDGAMLDEVTWGPEAEYTVNFLQMLKDKPGASASVHLSFSYLCKHQDDNRYIGDIKVKAVKAAAAYKKSITVKAELPPTSVTNCAKPGEKTTSCIDLILSYHVTPAAGSGFFTSPNAGEGFFYSESYTLSADGTLTKKRTGDVLQPGAVDEIVQKF